MANAVVPGLANGRSFAAFIRGQLGLPFVSFQEATGELDVPSVTQPTLDSAITAYNADQANIDATFEAAEDAATTGEEQQRYNNDRVDIAIVDALREELNVLRALHALPDIPQGQMDGNVRAKIATP